MQTLFIVEESTLTTHANTVIGHKSDMLLDVSSLNDVVVLSGAEIRSVCTEAGMFAIRARRKMATEKDFLEAVNKVIKAYAKFSATPRYMTYN